VERRMTSHLFHGDFKKPLSERDRGRMLYIKRYEAAVGESLQASIGIFVEKPFRHRMHIQPKIDFYPQFQTFIQKTTDSEFGVVVIGNKQLAGRLRELYVLYPQVRCYLDCFLPQLRP